MTRTLARREPRGGYERPRFGLVALLAGLVATRAFGQDAAADWSRITIAISDHLHLLALGVVGTVGVLVHDHPGRIPPPYQWLRATLVGLSGAAGLVLIEALVPGSNGYRRAAAALFGGGAGGLVMKKVLGYLNRWANGKAATLDAGPPRGGLAS